MSCASESQRDAIINGALILLVLGVSLVGAFVVARSMIRSLRRLQDTATRVAQDRLPELVKQLSESDPQDVDTSVESVGVHSRDEIGQVAAAFDDVHREAVRLAAEQALLRGNVNAMFTNLSRRSQGLIQRQLSLISELESREADPDQLSSLFKLDHLATRMRRNGENLLVLAGEEPGRRWTRPVPLVDVLRAAASEVEQYERIELASVPATEVAGRVVNDLVHLLAELLENATSFSSPQTKVRVTGHALPDGRVLVEIHDTGIGLSPEDLAAINERLGVAAHRGRLGLPPHGSVRGRPAVPATRHPHPAAPLRLRRYDRAGHAPRRCRPRRQEAVRPACPVRAARAPCPRRAGRSRGTRRRSSGTAAPAGPRGGSRPGLRRRLRRRSPAAAPLGRPARRRSRPRGQVGAGRPVRVPRFRAGTAAPAPAAGQGQGGGLAGAFGSGPAAAARRTLPARNEARQSGFPQSAPGAGDRGRQLPPLRRPARRAARWQPAAARSRSALSARRPPAGATSSRPPRGSGRPRTRRAATRTATATRGPGSTAGVRTARLQRTAGRRGGPAAPRPGCHRAVRTPRCVRRPGRLVPVDTASSPARTQRPRPQDPASTRAVRAAGLQRPAGSPRRAGGSAAPGAATRTLPPQPQPEALPPAGPGDGRTPLYDTLETNWFHGPQNGQPAQQPPPQPPAVPQQPPERPVPPMPQRAPAQSPATPGNAPNASGAAWRTSPNDELVRQAERVRKPAAGGVTTSGLPRRVPRANLVPGTAQQQSHQAGPQVSRAPDDVRGRLTNLRRGIQQGRQARTARRPAASTSAPLTSRSVS